MFFASRVVPGFTAALACLSSFGRADTPEYLEDQFQIPAGFRIYKAAPRDLCGGSYDIEFDGQGRLLVGDGRRVRRLYDDDGDGLYDRHEVIAEGLGGRGPQGLLVYGDRLFAVGGDGVQLFEGYTKGGKLERRGRIGESFRTGGDHDAHTVLRGVDGYVYFITGDGGGARDRRHITEKSSPALFERDCSVFRISPDGKRWECVGTGGRNSPNVGMNYLAELFSFDSDMEWHVELPWWRPIRVHHWLRGGDQGWKGVGAYPPYYIDNVPGILDVGRGSPNWGLFYEHDQFPAKYRDNYLVCDYMTKSATTGGYNAVGRLYSFALERSGAGWKAKSEVFAEPRPGAKTAKGQRIQFALVDVAVAPDGSIFLSDHNQGVWRVFFDPDKKLSKDGAPAIAPKVDRKPAAGKSLVDALVSIRQPASEWSRLEEEGVLARIEGDAAEHVRAFVLEKDKPVRRRLRALRLVAPSFRDLPEGFLAALTKDSSWEIRSQATWLLGLRGGGRDAEALLTRSLKDRDAFVRRRALEALTRFELPQGALKQVAEHLNADDRLERYAAMIVLSHAKTEAFLPLVLSQSSPQARLRGLVATVLRRERADGKLARPALAALLSEIGGSSHLENRLDLLRVLGLFRGEVKEDEALRRRVEKHLLETLLHDDIRLRREAARLIGDYDVGAGFDLLTEVLTKEEDHVEAFHLAQCLAKISNGWSSKHRELAVEWFLSTQEGWFAQFGGKGRQFPHFWRTVVQRFVSRHAEAFTSRVSSIRFESIVGRAALDQIAKIPTAPAVLVGLYRTKAEAPGERRRVLEFFRRVRSKEIAALLRDEFLTASSDGERVAILRALAAQDESSASTEVLVEGLDHGNDDVFRECAMALARVSGKLGDELARRVITRLRDHRGRFHAAQRLLVSRSGTKPDNYNPKADIRKAPPEGEWREGAIYWVTWYADAFGKKFQPIGALRISEKSNDELRKFLLSDAVGGGDAKKGAAVYERALCATCHGGATRKKGASIFGPELAGVTTRLRPEQVADAIVFPSNEVADRFKAKVVQVRGGVPKTGFITEETDDSVTLVDQENVHRFARKDVLFIAPQETSLMPERLLARLTFDEIRDLMAYLGSLGANPK